jgi:hypothetical protein
LAEPLKLPTEAAWQQMRQMYADVQRLLGAAARRGWFEEDHSEASEVHVVLTPAGGIPALVEGPDTGTAFGTGDEPGGSAECRVFRRTAAGMEYQGFTRDVYNLMPVDIPGRLFVLAVRDKWGDWYVPPVPLPFGQC